MTEVNPLAGAILAPTQAQRQLANDKRRQSRRAQVPHKSENGESEQHDHRVESPDIVTLIGDDAREHGEAEHHVQRRHDEEAATPSSEDDGTPHIDITG